MYKLTKYMDELNANWAIDKIRGAITELEINMIEYEGVCIAFTLVGSGAGQYISKEFLEQVGVSETDILIAEENCFIEDLARTNFEYLENDLKTMCEKNDFDLGRYNLNIGYNENDGAIDVSVFYMDYDDISHLDEDEYDKRKALAEHYGCTIADIVDIDEDKYQIEGTEYLIVDEGTADSMCRDTIEDTLWAFRPSFLADETGFSQVIFDAIMSNDKCDSNNEPIKELIEATCGLDSFAESAIQADGRGNYLNHYNGQEDEIDIDGDTYYGYRLD